MPIVASRGREIQRLLDELADPKRRTGAVMRLRSLGSRVVPHAAAGWGRLDPSARRALLEALREVDTADAKGLKKLLGRPEPGPGKDSANSASPRREPPSESEEAAAPGAGAEAMALDTFRALPPPRPNERASISRERGEAHLALARAGSRLARKDLLLSLNTLDAGRTRVYCEAAGLIGDGAFMAPLARIAPVREEAAKALAEIAIREKITARSKILRDLDEPLRLIVAKALVGI